MFKNENLSKNSSSYTFTLLCSSPIALPHFLFLISSFFFLIFLISSSLFPLPYFLFLISSSPFALPHLLFPICSSPVALPCFLFLIFSSLFPLPHLLLPVFSSTSFISIYYICSYTTINDIATFFAHSAKNLFSQNFLLLQFFYNFNFFSKNYQIIILLFYHKTFKLFFTYLFLKINFIILKTPFYLLKTQFYLFKNSILPFKNSILPFKNSILPFKNSILQATFKNLYKILNEKLEKHNAFNMILLFHFC